MVLVDHASAGSGGRKEKKILHQVLCLPKIDGVPSQRDHAGPQPMPVGDQRHSGMAMEVAIPPGGIDQTRNVAIDQNRSAGERR